MTVQPVPEGFHTINPYVVVKGAARFIDFVKNAFGAEEQTRMDGPGGTVGHATVKIGDSLLMLSDASPQFPPTSVYFYLYVGDADAAFNRAVAAGATPTMEPIDQFYGDRRGDFTDNFGNRWSVATQREIVPPEEMKKRTSAAMQQQG
jgi:PhnB protein